MAYSFDYAYVCNLVIFFFCLASDHVSGKSWTKLFLIAVTYHNCSSSNGEKSIILRRIQLASTRFYEVRRRGVGQATGRSGPDTVSDSFSKKYLCHSYC